MQKNDTNPAETGKAKRFSAQCIAVFAFGCLSVVAKAQEHNPYYAIAPQPLFSALTDFAGQSGIQFVYDAALVKGLSSPGIKRETNNSEALAQLLQNSGLSYRFTSPNTVVLFRPDQQVNDKTSDNAYLLPVAQVNADAADNGGGATLPKVQVEADAEVDLNDPVDTSNPYNKSYSASNATTATKTDTPVFDTPLSVQVVPKSILKDQQAIRPKDVLKNISGVQTGFSFGTLRDKSVIRGFDTDNFPQGGSYLDGSLQFEAANSLANIERVEVLKGAAAMLYGRLEPGGIINYVSKRPQAKPYYSLQQQFGSFNSYRTTADATGSLTADNSLMYRINFEYMDNDSFRDFVYSKRSFVAPSLTWKLSDATQIDFDYIYQDQDDTSDWGMPAFRNRVAQLPTSRYFGAPSNYNETTVNQAGVTLRHAFNEDWKLKTKFSYYNMNGSFLQTTFYPVADFNDPANGVRAGDGDRNLYNAAIGTRAYFFTNDLTGKFETGPLQHTLLIGQDYYNRFYKEDNQFVDRFFTSNRLAPPSLNIFDRNFNLDYDYRSVLNGQPWSPNSYKDEWWGFFIQDQIDLYDKWHIMLGARFDHADSKRSFNFARTVDLGVSNNKASPRVGLLYQPLEWLGLYANYSEGLTTPNVNSAFGPNVGPQESNQYEAGLKGQWFDNKLTANAVYFHLEKDNIAQPVSIRPNAPTDLAGKARSQGLELDLSGQITPSWHVIATYTYLDAIFKNFKTLGGQDFTDNELPNVARHMGSLWSTYGFDSLGVPGLKVGAGVFIQGKRFGDQANSFTMPGYARVDALVSYSRKFNDLTFTTQFNVNNLLDKDYFESSDGRPSYARVSSIPGTPRSFMGSIQIEY